MGNALRQSAQAQLPGSINALSGRPMVPLSDDEQWLQDTSATTARNLPYARGNQFQTALSPEQESAFRAWVAQNKVPFNPHTAEPQDYDMRGFYQGLQSGDPDAQTAINQNDGLLHFPDKWKTPAHHSFSSQSKYAQPDAPTWINDTQLADQHSGDVLWDEQYMGQQVPITMKKLPPVGQR